MFGQRLQQLRVRAGLSQAELAQRIGVQVETVRDWEVDEGQPGSGVVSKLAGALGVPEEELAAGFAESQQIRDRQVVAAQREKP